MDGQREIDRRPRRAQFEAVLEAGFVLSFLVLQVGSWARVAQSQNSSWQLLLGVPLGWVLADLLSGIFHFLADNFGSPSTPLVGRAIIATFREHHTHPKKMLEHSFFERNGWNCAGGSVLALPPLLTSGTYPPFLSSTLLTASLFVSLTNQIHTWAHDARRPRWVRTLQKSGVILSPRAHARHHRPFNIGALYAPRRRSPAEALYRIDAANQAPQALALVPTRSTRIKEGYYCITSGICDRVWGLISSR